MMKKKPILTFKIEADQDQWHAYCPELPGCHSFGATPEEAMKNLKNAVQIYIEDEIEYQGFEDLYDLFFAKHQLQNQKFICFP